MRTITVLAALALAACAPQAAMNGDHMPAHHHASGAVAPPTPGDVAIHIQEAQAGTTVRVPVGQRFAVELVGVPTAGYVWQADSVPDFIAESGEASGPTSQAQLQPGFTGGSHWEVLMFTANAAGTGDLTLAMRRPWETSEPPSRTFRVTIEAY